MKEVAEFMDMQPPLVEAWSGRLCAFITWTLQALAAAAEVTVNGAPRSALQADPPVTMERLANTFPLVWHQYLKATSTIDDGFPGLV